MIGAGGTGAEHVRVLQNLPSVGHITIVGSTAQSAKASALGLGEDDWSDDFRSIVNSNEIDSVHVCTPDALHFAIAAEAIRSGKHVICEKPLTTDSFRSRELAASADSAGVFAAVCYPYRFSSLLQRAQAVVSKGELGRVHSVRLSYLQQWRLQGVAGWRSLPDPNFSPVLRDIGTHALDIVEFVTQQTASVVNRVSLQEVATSVVEPVASIELSLSDATRALVYLSQASAGNQNSITLEIDGSEGALRWTLDDREMLRLSRVGDGPKLSMDSDLPLSRVATVWGAESSSMSRTNEFMRRFYQQLQNGVHDNSLPSFHDAARHVELLHSGGPT